MTLSLIGERQRLWIALGKGLTSRRQGVILGTPVYNLYFRCGLLQAVGTFNLIHFSGENSSFEPLGIAKEHTALDIQCDGLGTSLISFFPFSVSLPTCFHSSEN